MKLLANLECVTPPLTGIGHYTRQLAGRLAAHEQVCDFTGLYRNRCMTGSQTLSWLGASCEPASQQGSRWRGLLRSLPGSYSLRHQLRLKRFAAHARHLGDHVYWEPGLELAPFAGRRVATLYDLSHRTIPESHPRERIAFLDRQISHTLREADHLVTISNTMRDEIAAYAGLPPASISVVSPAADPSFRPLEAAERQRVRARLGLPDNYVLTLGTLEPRKNLARLIRAYEGLPDTLRRRWPIVCVGGKGWKDQALEAALSRLEQRGEVIRLGYVAQSDLPLITAAAGLLAYPSLYEGFGMPVVEALACGVAVLTSRGTAMQEIAGDNAFLAAPLEVDDIRRALTLALEDEEARHRLARQGPAMASRYDWDRSAEALLAALTDGATPAE